MTLNLMQVFFVPNFDESLNLAIAQSFSEIVFDILIDMEIQTRYELR